MCVESCGQPALEAGDSRARRPGHYVRYYFAAFAQAPFGLYGLNQP